MFTYQIVGNYELHEIQKEIAFLSIYRARDLNSNEQVLFWELFPKTGVSDTFRTEFRELAPKLCSLDHLNLLKVIAWGEALGRVYFITPEISGKLLSDNLGVNRTVQQSAEICEQICAGLAALHENGLLTAALSPNTVILDDNGRVLLCQYGFVQMINAEIRRGSPEGLLGYGIGNPSYLAPEIIAGRSPTQYTDQYSLGALMYTLLTGERPFPSPYSSETAIDQIIAPLSWPENAGRVISRSAVNFVLKSMDKHPAHRFNSLANAQTALHRLAAGKHTSISLTREQRRNGPKQPALARFWPVVAAALLLVIGLAGWRVTTIANSNTTAVAPTVTGTNAVISQDDAAILTRTVTQSPTAAPTEVTPEEVKVDQTAVPDTAAPEQASALTAKAAPDLLEGDLPRADEPITLANFTTLQEQTRIGRGRLNHADYTFDERTLAIASSAGVFLYRGNDLLKFIDTQDEATCVQFSLDDQTLTIGLNNGSIQLWDMNSLAPADMQLNGEAHTGPISRILYSPNRRQLITASYDQYIKIWDLNTKTLERSIHAHPKAIKDIAITDDALQLVSAAYDPVIMLWNMEDGSKISEFRHIGPVLSVDISSDGSYIAAGSASGQLRQWITIDSRPRSNPIEIGRAIYNLYYSEDSSKLYLGLDGGRQLQIDANYQPDKFGNVGIQKFDPVAERPYDELGADFEFTTFMTAPNSAEKTLQISWDSSATDSNIDIPGIVYNKFSYLQFSPDSKKLAIGGKLPGITVWNATTNRAVHKGEGKIPPGNIFNAASDKLVLITDQVIVATSPFEKDRIVDHVDTYSITDLSKNDFLSEYIQNGSVLFVMDDRLLIATSRAKSKFWDIDTDHETRLMEANDYGCQVTRSANDGQVFTVYSSLGVITTWDELTIGICKISTRFDNRMSALAPSRQWIIYINSSGQLEEISTIDAISNWRVSEPVHLTAMAVSPDGSLLVTGAEDGTLSFWDTKTGQKTPFSLNAHFGSVLSIAFSPNGKLLATGSADGTVRIWTTESQP